MSKKKEKSCVGVAGVPLWQQVAIDTILTPLFPYLGYKLYNKGKNTNNSSYKALGILLSSWTGYNALSTLKEDYSQLKKCIESKKQNQ